jgi:hypothetical protein
MNWNGRLIALLAGGVISLAAGLLFHLRLLPVGNGDPAYLSSVSFGIGGIVTLVAILLILFTGRSKSANSKNAEQGAAPDRRGM